MSSGSNTRARALHRDVSPSASTPSSTSFSMSMSDGKPQAFKMNGQRSRVLPEVSARMRAIRGKNTAPELVARRILHAQGFRFRLHRRDLPGTPDIVLPRFTLAILVHGCFWHRHAGCCLARLPKANPGYWLPKFKKIAARDRSTSKQLRSLGWQVLTIWECETKQPEILSARLARSLRGAGGRRLRA